MKGIKHFFKRKKIEPTVLRVINSNSNGCGEIIELGTFIIEGSLSTSAKDKLQDRIEDFKERNDGYEDTDILKEIRRFFDERKIQHGYIYSDDFDVL